MAVFHSWTFSTFWSSPRNISTALMYSFAQHSDFVVVDEPLYAHYLVHTDTEAKHPATEEILATMEQDGEQVVKEMLTQAYEQKNVLFKQMTHHLVELNIDFLAQMENVLLIRSPRLIIASYAKVIPNPSMQDVGVKQQFELMQHLQSIGKLTAVVDAVTLLKNPKHILIQLCEKLEVPFQEQMLSWQAGAREEDGIWAKYWYGNVHQSTGFQTYVEKEVKLSEKSEALAMECQTYYEKLLKQALK
ncbi:MAG: hypothetical protein AAGG68_31100 [Bacteroidota bacterium]